MVVLSGPGVAELDEVHIIMSVAGIGVHVAGWLHMSLNDCNASGAEWLHGMLG